MIQALKDFEQPGKYLNPSGYLSCRDPGFRGNVSILKQGQSLSPYHTLEKVTRHKRMATFIGAKLDVITAGVQPLCSYSNFLVAQSESLDCYS
jgi:hypothetical protein